MRRGRVAFISKAVLAVCAAAVLPIVCPAQWLPCGASGPMQCAPTGNVGTGTTNPTQPFQIAKSPLVVGDDPYQSANNAAGLGFYRDPSGNIYADFKTYAGAMIYFRSGAGAQTGTTPWMTENPANGYVGIGTPNPTNRLTVTGGNIGVWGNDNSYPGVYATS